MDGRDQKTHEEDASWSYKPDAEGTHPAAVSQVVGEPGASDDPGDIEWTASEFIAHHKDASWYGLLVVVGVLVSLGLYLITRDMFSVIAVATLGVVMGVAAARKPRVVRYHIDKTGIVIGNKRYSFSNYKSFAYIEEEAFASVQLIPMKRFAFPVGMYLAPDDKHMILDLLSEHLPLERSEPDAFERLAQWLRF